MSDPMNNERRDLPSASGFARYALCAGSFLLERAQPESTPSPESKFGTDAHDAIASGGTTGDDIELVDVVLKCQELENEFLIRYVGDREGGLLYREKRLWCHDLTTMEAVFSGKPDGVLVFEDRAFVWDFKTGRSAIEPAESNWQLRALAVLVADNFSVNSVVVALLGPWLRPQLTVCEYDLEAIGRAREACSSIADRVRLPGQPRNPSVVACRYCRGKAVCPEARAVLQEVSVVPLASDEDEGYNLVAPVDGETMARLLDASSQADRVIEAIRERAKEMLKLDPASIPGWQVRETKPRVTINDTGTVWERAIASGIPSRDFVDSCRVSNSGLFALLKKHKGVKGAIAARLVEGLTMDCTKVGSPSTYLERADESEPAKIEAPADNAN